MSKEGKSLQWNKWSRTVLLLGGLTSKWWHTYDLPRFYIQVSNTFAIIVFIAETTSNFINNTINKIFERKLNSLVWHLQAISSLQQFKTLLCPCCILVLVYKHIISKYGRTRSKLSFSTVGAFYLTLIWVGILEVRFEVGGSKIIPHCLKLVRIMLETSNLVRKYTHICRFRKYTF